MLKKSTKNIMKQRPSLLFTHSQYNFTTYLQAEILWRSHVQLAFHCHVAQYLNQSYMTTSGWSAHTELRLKYKGFNWDCNRKTHFILQCTRQLSMFMLRVCLWCQCACVKYKKRAQTLVRWRAESLYIQSSLVNKMWLWAKQATDARIGLQKSPK